MISRCNAEIVYSNLLSDLVFPRLSVYGRRKPIEGLSEQQAGINIGRPDMFILCTHTISSCVKVYFSGDLTSVVAAVNSLLIELTTTMIAVNSSLVDLTVLTVAVNLLSSDLSLPLERRPD